MANKRLFQSLIGSLLPSNSSSKASVHNEAGGKAYSLSRKHALAQYVATGCLNGTFYASAENQLEQILSLCNAQEGLWQHHDFISTEFIAQTAVYAREKAFMKDTSALLVALLTTREETEYLKAVFPRVIDNGKMLRSFVQIMRSGVVGRKSLGTLPKKLILDWFDSRTDEQVFSNSIGNDPSIADVIKMVHPTPKTASRRALYGYLLGKEYDVEDLPTIVRDYEAFKRGETEAVPSVPFQMLTSLPLSKRDWTAIAANASWQTLRMNINTFARHGVLEDAKAVSIIITRLQDAGEISRAKVFPYQLLTAYRNLTTADALIESSAAFTNDMTKQHISAKRSQLVDALHGIEVALESALEAATANIPALDGKMFICVDVSGSMQSPITGERKGATTKVRCIDVAGLIASAVLRKNPSAEVIPFEQHVVKTRLIAHDSVMTNAQRLAAINGGGTNCSAALRHLNEHHATGTLVLFVSDNESWMDKQSYRSTALMHEWSIFKTRNPQARLVCLDLQPYATTQAAERDDVLNIGGFSDEVFSVISEFAHGTLSEEHWLGVIERIEL
ncbi:MAG: TROVE domain-containing protein [Ignavibacteria bacterium]|nr:TROVE domain-containing protein [Ignavibacteria bacterium]